MTDRDRVLSLFSGAGSPRPPCFSGLVNITRGGLDSLGLQFSEIHDDAEKLAAAAATSYRLCGWQSAVVPADLCVEASALGAEVDFRADVETPMWPLVAGPLAGRVRDFRPRWPDRLDETRVGVVARAIAILKRDVGREVVVGAWVPGPLTLAMQVLELDNLYMDSRREPEAVARALDALVPLLVDVGRAYRAAGADFITVHEMGGSPGVVGPSAFSALVLPPLNRLFHALPAPRVVSICGRTDAAIPVIARAECEAISVDQLNTLSRSRSELGRRLLFGNIDPVRTLSEGDAGQVRAAVRDAIEAGVDAVWPGCDLPPETPIENLRVMREEAER